MAELKLESRDWTSMGHIFCLCLLLPTAKAFSISVKNGTFEAESLDVQMAVKITPLPQDVSKFTWYHCSSPDACSAFYEIDNLENRKEQIGELGKRTTHGVAGNEQEYIITLVITDLKDTDQGEYCCLVRIAGDILQGNMRLTKLEALRDISGVNTTVGVGNSAMSLVIRMFPPNVTLYWVKCFQNIRPEPSAHFYTYDSTLNKIIAAGDLGTRTSHRYEELENKRQFSLVIQNPGPDDEGPYCCQVDAVGLTEPRLVIIWVELVASTSHSVIEIGTVTNKGTTSKLGEIPHESSKLVVILLTVLLLVTIGLSIYLYWRRRVRRGHKERENNLHINQRLLQNNQDSGGK